jgi:hypothetical protein
MHRNVKIAWVKALRSGDYEQGLGYERYMDTRVKHDPLGVLGELAEFDTMEIVFEPIRSADGERVEAEHVTNWECLLAWGGVDPAAKYGKGDDGELISEVIKMNDNGDTFEEIADYIEDGIGSGHSDADEEC